METFGFDWDLKQFEIQNSSGKPPKRGGGIDGMEKGVLGCLIMGWISQLSDSAAAGYIRWGNGCVMQ